MLRCRKASLCDKKRHLRSLCNDQFSRGGCSGLRRRNLEGGFVLYLERHRARDKAFLRGGIVQAARAMFSSEPAASLACGRNVTLSNCPAPSDRSISTPKASSLYATTTIPASAQRCRYQS